MEAALNDLDPVPMDDQQAWELSYHEGPMIEMDHDDNNWQLPSHASFQGKDPILSAMLTSADMFSPSPPMPMPITYSPDVSDLDFDSIRLLLDRYQHTLVPYFVPVRIRAKSPWETLHIPKVHETLGEVMVRGDGGNARLALTFAVLGASAFHLDILRPRTNAVAGPLWRVLGDRYRVRAKSRLKSCLRNISSGKKEEDYKDVLVALLSMVTISVVSGEMDEAYAYLRDIERLIALYGVDKIRKSVGVRMLHSTFLYLRTLQASIGIFGHSAPGAMLNGHLRGSGDGESASARASASMLASQNAGLWTELLQAEEHSDSTATRQTGDQPRVCHSCGANKSIFEQIYSVPESLFLLISRATVLTQEVQRLKQEQARSGHVDHDPFSVKVSQLETDICGWKNDIDMPMPGPSQNTARTNTAHCSNCHLTISRPDAESESESGMNLNLDQNQNGQRPPLCEALLYHFREALHAALLIYFYRCVRNVDTLFLQQFAEKTIEHLLRYAEYKRQSLDPSSNLCWPGFIAGCEAMDPKSRRRISAWFTAETAQTGIRMFEVAGQAVQQVWDARELANDRNLPWSQVLKESRTLDKLVLS
ncbi:hypothetical protein A1O3_10524 [Capronia epimyces CBS 606.96]|uniref:Transcription factor domain-containing protein n=1 Tax=Capronia epimyces CBS 606.96 TaxID=1182542 RepID=W9Y365_9EURO|nr:uncharacterized protein A1O3_10524 [Capronia epimyces CBS 606.96]EXJ76879.1 hypothetical protein A1O3_10524 [Capronia epimyces CBS 606.96]